MADNTTLNPMSGGDTNRSVQKGGASGPKTSAGIIDIGGSGAENLLSAGQKTMAGSVPVTLASDQPAVPVSASSFTVIPSEIQTRPANTTQYAVGDAVGDGTVWTFTGSARSNAGTGTMLGVLITDTSKQATLPQFNLWLFSAAPAIPADNAVFNPSEAELATLVDVISVTNFIPASVNGALIAPDINRPFKCGTGSMDLFGVLTAANAYTPTSAEKFGVYLKVGQD
jgi:hypothetical protein